MKVTDLNMLKEREKTIVPIKHRNRIVQFKIWNLTGIEIDNLEKEKAKREQELLSKRPKARTETKQGKDVLLYDDPVYQKALAEYTELKRQKVDIWNEYKLLELGLFNCNDWKIEGNTEEEQMKFVRNKLGAYWIPIVNKIIEISWIMRENIENF